ncbi:hypothetical protein SDC9_142610 [bioreactor metagenome]|uniref:Uncharacterized protein n=1 Tax=bioreactor metagenome TaxID=1076179 RepID=A0A645E1M0_9ZZZZ
MEGAQAGRGQGSVDFGNEPGLPALQYKQSLRHLGNLHPARLAEWGLPERGLLSGRAEGHPVHGGRQ